MTVYLAPGVWKNPNTNKQKLTPRSCMMNKRTRGVSSDIHQSHERGVKCFSPRIVSSFPDFGTKDKSSYAFSVSGYSPSSLRTMEPPKTLQIYKKILYIDTRSAKIL